MTNEEPLELKILRQLQVPTASLMEDLVLQEVTRIFDGLFGEEEPVSIARDQTGNIVIHYEGDPNRDNPKSLALLAHSDHPAFSVDGRTQDDTNLILRMQGGLNPESLILDAPLFSLGTEVYFHRFVRHDGGIITVEGGIITVETSESVLHTSLDQRDGNPSKRYHATANGLDRVDFATLKLPSLSVRDNYVSAPVIDDLGGIAINLAALRNIVNQKLGVDVYVVVTRAEEIGLLGAYGLVSHHVLPRDTLYVAVDTTSCPAKWDRADTKEPLKVITSLGAGAVIRTGDNSTPLFNGDANELLISAGRALQSRGEAVQAMRMYGGSCEASILYAMGARATALAIPLEGWHNGLQEGRVMSERVALSDLASGVNVLTTAAQLLANDPRRYSRFHVDHLQPSSLKFRDAVAGLYGKEPAFNIKR